MGCCWASRRPEGFFAQLKRHEEDPRAPRVVAEPLLKLHVMAIDPTLPGERLLDPVSVRERDGASSKQAGYEYVIVDSPPVLGSLDCNVISDAVDAMILTALPMKSLRRDMRKAVEQLEPAPILGVVVLEAEASAPSWLVEADPVAPRAGLGGLPEPAELAEAGRRRNVSR